MNLVINDYKDIMENAVRTAIIVGIWFAVFVVMKLFTQFVFARKFKKRRKTIINLFLNVAQYIIFFVMVFIVLNTWDINTSTILAGAGFLGLLFGFGAQKLINDFISGFFIIFENQYDIDDAVLINDRMGTIENIGLKTTWLRTWNGELHIFANGDIKNIVNYSKYSSLAIVDIKISYDNKIADIEQMIKSFIETTVFTNDSMLERPQFLGIQEMSEFYYCLRIIARTKSFEHFGVQRYLRKELKQIMEEHQVKMLDLPFTSIEKLN